MWIRRVHEPRDSEITPHGTWLNRRHFIGRSAKAAVAGALVPGLLTACDTEEGSAATRRAGGDYDTISIAYQYSWGGRR